MSGITVREIAERIRRPGEDLIKVVDRLRNWTDEDLLTPMGEKNPGTGKRRLYPKSAIVDALVLSVLTDAVGMHAVTGRSFAKLFKTAKSELQTDILATVGAGQRFITISLSRDDRGAEIGTSWAAGLAQMVSTSKHDSHVVIDLWKLHERLHSKPEN